MQKDRGAPPGPQLSTAAGLEGQKMLISLMLVCAILAAMAFGVLVAYGVCLGFFRLMAGRAAAPVRTGALETAPAKAKI
ncbi:MAG TPA: hypothetical protein VGM11_04885 [Acidobacteriaceae bacterium]